jgi:prepilin-type N-terminal cleavage/methylation domain-containing protein
MMGHCRQHSRRRRTGYTLLEVIIALGLLSAFAGAAGRLFVATINTTHESAQAQQTIAAMESMAICLRADAWDAGDFAVKDPQNVALSLSGNRRVSWSIHDGAVTRTESGTGSDSTQRRWENLPAMEFASANGRALHLQSPGSKDVQPMEMTLVSQRLIAGGAQ